MKIIDFESDLINYRRICEQLPHIVWDSKHEPLVSSRDKAESKLEVINHMIQSFKDEHKPVFKECKCYYCKNKLTYNCDDNNELNDLPF